MSFKLLLFEMQPRSRAFCQHPHGIPTALLGGALRAMLGTVVLVTASLFFAWTSWLSFRSPRQFGERLGLNLGGLDGLNEIRAQYGGFFSQALVNWLALIGVLSRQTSFILDIVVFSGLIAGRFASLAANDRGADSRNRLAAPVQAVITGD